MNLFPGHIVYDSESTYEILSFKNRENANVRNLETGEKKKAKETFDFVVKTAGKHYLLGEQVDNSTLKPNWVIGLGWSHAMFIIVLEKLSNIK